jgi:hypothetical protein
VAGPPSVAVPSTAKPEPTPAVAPSAPPQARRGWRVAALIAAAIVVVAGAAVLAVHFSSPDGVGVRFPPTVTATATATATMVPCVGMSKCVAFTPADPMHADMMEALPAATQLVQSIDKGASLCDMSLVGSVDGTLAIGSDMLKPSTTAIGTMRFAGKRSHSVNVVLMTGRLMAMEVAQPCQHPVPVPVCTPKAAARAAVASGVPRGTSAILTYHHDSFSGTTVWEFVPPSRPDLQRRIDGHTCAVRPQ